MPNITVTWELISQGSYTFDPEKPHELEGMTEDEIIDFFADEAHIEAFEQGNYWVDWSGLEDAIRILKEKGKRK